MISIPLLNLIKTKLFSFVCKESYIDKAKSLRKTFNERTKKTQDHVKELMHQAHRDVWKCDLSPQTYGNVYNFHVISMIEKQIFFLDHPRYQITNFLEGFIDNEANLNAENDCKQSCSDYKVAKSYTCLEETLCSKEPENPKSKCNGTLYNCDFIEADMSVCFTVIV